MPNSVKVVTRLNGNKIKEVFINGQKVSVIDVSVEKTMGRETLVKLTIPAKELDWSTELGVFNEAESQSPNEEPPAPLEKSIASNIYAKVELDHEKVMDNLKKGLTVDEAVKGNVKVY